MHWNDAGRMVEGWWFELEKKFPSIETDAHVVMPNHFHGIIVIVGADLPPNVGADLPPNVGADLPPNVGADLRVCPSTKGAHAGAPLPRIVQWFKTMTTNEYIRKVRENGWIPFPGRLWQRNYYEHVIRNEKALNGIREYIGANPSRWEDDPENPNRRMVGTTSSSEGKENPTPVVS